MSISELQYLRDKNKKLLSKVDQLTQALAKRKSVGSEVKRLNSAVKKCNHRINELETENNTMLEVIEFVLNQPDAEIAVKALKIAMSEVLNKEQTND